VNTDEQQKHEPTRAELLLLLEQAIELHPDLGRILAGEDPNLGLDFSHADNLKDHKHFFSKGKKLHEFN
jgi:hypothetical protein